MSERIAVVTGATGFVGRALVPALRAAGWRVRAALRQRAEGAWDEAVCVGDLGGAVAWDTALTGAEAVFHLAARVHQLHDTAPDPLAAFRQINATATATLATACERTGVRRLVYLSTIKVHGEATPPGQPFRASDRPAPHDPYALTKLEGEAQVLGRGALEGVVLRPPLVYGPGVGANFLRMMQAIEAGRLLPLGAIANRRSLIYVGNLADALVCAADAPGVVGQAFPVCDGGAVSTPQLLRSLGAALGRPARLLPVPPAALRLALTLIGRRAEAERLTGSLEIDDHAWRATSGWQPPFSFEAGLAATAASLAR